MTTGRFGSDNLFITIDNKGIVTVQFDSNAVIAKAGTPSCTGTPRRRDLVASSRGAIRIGNCRVNINATR